ncbi:MAG: hypothetical protein HY816_12450 [Candidatus Wallbacteria bacterium]|nr:hypothetical protein [Candidatus Wallbacteria bacterium]
MGYLEKVFLGTLILFALLILFMFGLYFDIGSMMKGTVQRTSDMGGPGSYSRATAQIERSSVKPEVTVRDIHTRRMPSSSSSSSSAQDRSVAEANFDSIYSRVSKVQGPPTMEEKMDLKRKRLASQGYGQEFIEMEVRSMDDRAVDDTCGQVDGLMSKGAYDDAEKLLLELMAAADPRDLINMQRLRMKLQQLYFDSGQLEKYRETMKQLFDGEEKILSIQAASKMMEDKRDAEAIQSRQTELSKKRGEFDQYFDQIQQQVAETGSVKKLSERQKSEIKAGLLREQEAGRISADALQEALTQLEDVGMGGSK